MTAYLVGFVVVVGVSAILLGAFCRLGEEWNRSE